jgi:hypothetical protein
MQAGEHNSDSFSNWVAAEARILKQHNNRVNASEQYLLRSFQAVLAKQLAAVPVKTENTAALLAAVPGSLGKPQTPKNGAKKQVKPTGIKSDGFKVPKAVETPTINKAMQAENPSAESAAAQGWLSPSDAAVRERSCSVG